MLIVLVMPLTAILCILAHAALGVPTAAHSPSPWETVFRGIPSAEGAREHLAYYTALPHVAATPEDHQTAVWTQQRLQAFGFNASVWPTDVLMSYPEFASVRLLGPRPFTAQLREDVLPEDPTSGVFSCCFERGMSS